MSGSEGTPLINGFRYFKEYILQHKLKLHADNTNILVNGIPIEQYETLYEDYIKTNGSNLEIFAAASTAGAA